MHPRWFKITSFIDCDRCSLFIDRQAPYSGDALCQLRRVLRAVSNQILALAVTFHWLTYPPPPWPDLRPVTTSIHMHISCLPFLWWLSAWTWLIAAIILYHSLSFSIILYHSLSFYHSDWSLLSFSFSLLSLSDCDWSLLSFSAIVSGNAAERSDGDVNACFCCLLTICQKLWMCCLLMIC